MVMVMLVVAMVAVKIVKGPRLRLTSFARPFVDFFKKMEQEARILICKNDENHRRRPGKSLKRKLKKSH